MRDGDFSMNAELKEIQEMQEVHKQNQQQIPTPRTDVKEYAPPLQTLVDADFSRTLERELVQKDEAFWQNESAIKELCGKSHMSYPAINAVKALKSEREELQQKLDTATHYSNLYIEETDKKFLCNEDLTCGTCFGCVSKERDKLKETLDKYRLFLDALKVSHDLDVPEEVWEDLRK